MPALVLNGQSRSFENTQNLADLLRELGLEARPVVIEHNGSAVPPRLFAATPLAAGDRVEIVELAAGG